MQTKKILLVYIIAFIAISSVYPISGESLEPNNPPHWNDGWLYKQEINMPISTEDPFSIYQPIDIEVEFKDPCWAKDSNNHSIRVLCWSGERWHELESQIYDLVESEPRRISRCGLVFLVPEIADGNERYFVYYDKNEKSNPNYVNHVDIEDSYYYFEPIKGVAAEGDYYKIIEDGFVTYGVGQKGNAINRPLSQIVIKQKPETKEFSLMDSDNSASFAFSYHVGVEDEDEISSDQKLLSKDVLIDGNLMLEFKITSESNDKTIRTTNFYKYYYCPTDTKRISVHVNHQILEDLKVKGIEDIDGRYGAIVSFRSTSEKIEKMRFGEILPYLHVYGENNEIKEYNSIPDPDGRDREWVIAHKDDCDVGEDAWISFDEGNMGKAHGVVFASNKNIVKSGTGERDGLEITLAEKEYLKVIGSEIDYAAISWGRNSYEKGEKHDLDIPNDLIVEYDAEFYTSQEGGYEDVSKEADFFRTLIEHRHNDIDGSGDEDENIYILTVLSKFTGRFFSYPTLSNILNQNLSQIMGELYNENCELIAEGFSVKSLLAPPMIKFPKLSLGNYTIKIYRIIGDSRKSFIGFKSVELKEDMRTDVYCTWPIEIKIKAKNQQDESIENVEMFLYKNEKLVDKIITNNADETIISAPFVLVEPYTLKASYKGFKIYDEEVPIINKNVDIGLNLYNLDVVVKDTSGFSPGVDVRPFLTSSKMEEEISIQPDKKLYGKYTFDQLPEAEYSLHLSHGSFSDEVKLNIPADGELIDIKFNAEYELSIDLYDSFGNAISDSGKKINICREGKIICESITKNDIISLPPAEYTAKVYSKDKLIGFKTIVLTNDKKVSIVTTIDSVIPNLLTLLALLFIGEIIVLFLIKKISLNTFLKLLAMSFILLSLVQPWWILNASSCSPFTEKNSEMYLVPRTIVEQYSYDNTLYLELATIPEIFTDFLGFLLAVVVSGFALLGISFLPNIIYKRRFYKLLISASIAFLILVSIAYFVGMSTITELSLGSLQGDSLLDVVIPSYKTVEMSATWGLGIGFYLCAFASITAFLAGLSDLLSKKILKKQT